RKSPWLRPFAMTGLSPYPRQARSTMSRPMPTRSRFSSTLKTLSALNRCFPPPRPRRRSISS
ncbi:hypothetical protein LTR94_034530, partial [Friedmanniomyces endolithicus]